MATAPFRSLVMLITLFFLWGFITVLNDVLVPHWKQLFQLSYTESLLVQFCFFGAYFIGSLAYYLLSLSHGDPIRRIGYKRGLVLGLLVSATGCALFAPASWLNSYVAHLAALFVLGLGFTLLQIAANPFMAIIGPPEGASSRLNLAQAFNSLGTTLAPLIGGALIFSTAVPESAVRAPYLGLALILLVMAVVVRATPLPEPAPSEQPASGSVLRHPPLRRGMLAIFCYVGAEVTIGSLFINFLGLPSVMGLPEETAKHFLSLYWGGAMTGRFLGSLALNDQLHLNRRITLMLAVAAAMFVLLYVLNRSGGIVLDDLLPFIGLVLLNMTAFLLAGPRPSRALGLFSLLAMGLLALVIFRDGPLVMWALIAIGLFNSILWSNIFTVAIDGLGERTAQGSSLLVMMILGGALVPPFQGWVIERLSPLTSPGIAFHTSFAVPLLCYAYLAWYGFRGALLKPTRA